MILRKYRPSDCEEMAELFYNTVHTINKKDYTEEQINVWATGSVDLDQWNQSFLNHNSIVAMEGEKIVGFGDMDPAGYLDRLYVHKDYQRKGIATAICNELEQRAEGQRIRVQASVTAKPFFEKRGYQVKQKQQVKRQGVYLTNYIMEKISSLRRK